MVSVEAELDFGNRRTLEMYWEAINAIRAKHQKYNVLLSNVYSLYNELLA
jgi:hypothetical protein